MAKVCVVTRQLPGCDMVPSAVFQSPDDSSLNLDSYFESKMKDHVEQFTNKLVEFKKAIWSSYIMELE